MSGVGQEDWDLQNVFRGRGGEGRKKYIYPKTFSFPLALTFDWHHSLSPLNFSILTFQRGAGHGHHHHHHHGRGHGTLKTKTFTKGRWKASLPRKSDWIILICTFYQKVQKKIFLILCFTTLDNVHSKAPFSGLMIGSSISKRFAAFLEENDLFVPDDDDVDWASPLRLPHRAWRQWKNKEATPWAFIFPSS